MSTEPKIVGYVVTNEPEGTERRATMPVYNTLTEAAHGLMSLPRYPERRRWVAREVLEYPGTVERIALVGTDKVPPEGFTHLCDTWIVKDGIYVAFVRLYERTTPATRKLGRVV